MFTKITAFFMTIIMFIFPTANYPKAEVDTTEFNTNYTYVFVHGLGGWGEYDVANYAVPYWGTMGGDLMKYLNARGFNCVAASVSPIESSWDRACELYAQLTGTRTDYGKAHSEECNHDRYGEDFTGRALVDSWSAEDKINLLGHSFGGATIMRLAQWMANGDAAEIAATSSDDISPLFTGGKGDWIYSVTTLAAPLNGTTAYYIKDEILDDWSHATVDELIVAIAVGSLTNPLTDGRDEHDCAGYDMEPDRAMSICNTWDIDKDLYYFSFACDVTTIDENGNRSIDKHDMEIVYRGGGSRIMNWQGSSPSGYEFGEEWAANDGLVNTVSAKAPFNHPSTDFDANNINPGIWNMMPVYRGDHMSLQGGLLQTNNVRELYVNHLTMINTL